MNDDADRPHGRETSTFGGTDRAVKDDDRDGADVAMIGQSPQILSAWRPPISHGYIQRHIQLHDYVCICPTALYTTYVHYVHDVGIGVGLGHVLVRPTPPPSWLPEIVLSIANAGGICGAMVSICGCRVNRTYGRIEIVILPFSTVSDIHLRRHSDRIPLHKQSQ